MILFGLTGGIGMGKSTTGNLLTDRGIAVADTDVIARQMVEPGQPALEEICKRFGSAIIQSNGQLNRAALARIVFADPAARTALESILHPRIRDAWQTEAKKWDSEGRLQGVIIIPLLFETHSEGLFDKTICVACSEESQVRRLQKRNWTVEQIRQRNAAQWPVNKKITLSDFVIWNEGPLEIPAAQVDRIFKGVERKP